jgi:hypothetical protein
MDKRFDFVNEMKCQRGGVVLRIIIASITLVAIGGLILFCFTTISRSSRFITERLCP